MNTPVSHCPVPLEQQPLHEYQSLQESCFFRWATFEDQAFLNQGFYLSAFFGLLATPFAATSFALPESLGQFACTLGIVITGMMLILMVRLYLGWSYVCDRSYAKKSSTKKPAGMTANIGLSRPQIWPEND